MPDPVRTNQGDRLLAQGREEEARAWYLANGYSAEQADRRIAASKVNTSTTGRMLSGIPVAGKLLQEHLFDPGRRESVAAETAEQRARGRVEGLQGQIPQTSAVTAPQPHMAFGGGDPRAGQYRPDAFAGAVPGQIDTPGTVGMSPAMRAAAQQGLVPGPDALGRTPEQAAFQEGLILERAQGAARNNEDLTRPPTGSGSAFESAAADPLAIAAQRKALGKLTDIVDQGGLTAVDRARIAEARSNEDQYLRGQREATLANLEARGMSGSGTELMAQLAQQQEAGQRLSRANLATEAQAQMRAMQALGMLGGQAGQMRGQSYGEAANLASARDSIAKWNQQMQQNWQRYQDDQAWRRFAAERGIAETQMGQDYRESGRQQARADRAVGRRDQVVGAGLTYLTGQPTQGAQQAPQQPVYRPNVYGQVPSGSSEIIDPWEQ